MALLNKSIQQGGGGDYTAIQDFYDWVETNYGGTGNFPVDGIRGTIDDSNTYSEEVVVDSDIRPGEDKACTAGLELIAGDGQTPTISVGANASTYTFSVTSGCPNAYWLRLKGIAFTGTGNSQRGITLAPGTNKYAGIEVLDCTFTFSGGSTYGVMSSNYNSGGMQVLRSKFDGMAIGVSPGTSGWGCVAVNCEFIDLTTYGVNLSNAGGFMVGCSTLRCAESVRVWGAHQRHNYRHGHSVVMGNVFRSCSSVAVRFYTNTGAGYDFTPMAPFVGVDHNRYHNNTKDIELLGTGYALADFQALDVGPCVHGAVVDPEFTDETDGAENLVPTNGAYLGSAPNVGIDEDKDENSRPALIMTPGAWEGTYNAAPQAFAITDEANGGELLAEWTGTDYPDLAGVTVVVHDADHNVKGGARAADGEVYIGGLTNDVEVTYHAHCIWRGAVSAASDTDSATPTGIDLDFSQPTILVQDDGDGSVTVTVVGNLGQTSRLKYKLSSTATWLVHGTPITGNGQITDLTGLTEQRYDFMVQPRDAASGGEGPISNVVTLLLNQGSQAVIDQIMDCVDAVLDGAQLSTLDADGDTENVDGEVQLPPVFQDVVVGVIKIFPEADPLEATHAKLNQGTYRVNLAYCHQAVTDAQRTKDLRVAEQMQELFVGNRLTGMPSVYCSGSELPKTIDLEELHRSFNVIAVRTLVFSTLRARG